MREGVPSPPRPSCPRSSAICLRSPLHSVRHSFSASRRTLLLSPFLQRTVFFFIFSIRTIRVYNGTTCFKVLRPNKQTNALRLSLSFSSSLHLSLFLSLYLSLFSRTLHFHRFFVIPPPRFSSNSSFLHLSPVRIPARLLPRPSSRFILSVSIVRTTINKPLIGLTPISGALFEVNERPMVPRSPTFFNVSSFPSGYLCRPPFLAICHCRSLKCGLMTIYHLCYILVKALVKDAISESTRNICEVYQRKLYVYHTF